MTKWLGVDATIVMSSKPRKRWVLIIIPFTHLWGGGAGLGSSKFLSLCNLIHCCACRYPYLALVLNFSQTWALYCLVQFYAVIKDKLKPIKPLAKFLTFKSIVFLTWWQSVAVAFLFYMGAFRGSLAQELKARIQDYIICIEVSYLWWS